MNIGAAAALSGLPAKTIRYYEEIGLLRPAVRAANGYRAYAERDIRVLAFLHRARALGFGVRDCRELLALYQDRGRSSADVKAVALRRLGDIDRKIAELEALRAALAHVTEGWHGDERPAWPVPNALVGDEAGAGRYRRRGTGPGDRRGRRSAISALRGTGRRLC